mgnify:CR=1 FL=1
MPADNVLYPIYYSQVGLFGKIIVDEKVPLIEFTVPVL